MAIFVAVSPPSGGVFTKLGISSRVELFRALPSDQDLARHASLSALARASG